MNKGFLKLAAILERKLLKLAIFLLILLIILAGGIYYLATYRLKTSIQYAIKNASDGKYAFDADNVTLSVWRKTFTLNNARLICTDTSNVRVHYDVRVKDIYFSVTSFSDLMVNKKIMIDSLNIVEPDVRVFVHPGMIAVKKNSKPFNILEYLQNTLKKFNARSLAIKDAAFTYRADNAHPPFYANNINLTLNNFSDISAKDDQISGAANIKFSLGKQNWILPDGQHEISFQSLRFNGNKQRFEVDSFAFHRDMAENAGEMIIRVNKFFFNSKHLPAVLLRNELLIDSMVCIDPVIIFPASGNTKTKLKDSISSNSYIFNLIKVAFIDVQNGDVILKNKDGQSENASVQKTNLNIYNLTMNPLLKQKISTDSIKVNLSKIKFVTPDSLFQLGIDEFSFRNDLVLFRNVDFSPTIHNNKNTGISFKAPLLLIRNISLEDLLRRKITATEAELLSPVITYVQKGKTTPSLNPAGTGKNIALFYHSLHGLSELINVEKFKMIDGSAGFTSPGKNPVTASFHKVDALILLNKLFVSDSLVDIKHAMPDLRFGSGSITTPQVRITFNKYRFDGTLRHNWGEELSAIFSNGTTMQGKKIYWEVFDWDVLQNTGEIRLDLLSIAELKVSTPSGHKIAQKKTAAKKDLPLIRIAKLKAGKIDFTGEGSSTLRFTVKDLNADSIRSEKQYFTWQNAMAGIYHADLRRKDMHAAIEEIRLSTQKETILNGIHIELENTNGHTIVSIPVTRIQANLHSTNLDDLKISAVSLDRPVIDLVSLKGIPRPAKKSPPDPLKIPAIGKITIHQAEVSYTFISGSDTLKTRAYADINIKGLEGPGESAGSLPVFNILNGELTALSVIKKDLNIEIPTASFTLKERKGIGLSWKRASLKYSKDSTLLQANALSGTFQDDLLSINNIKKTGWISLINKISVSEGNIAYRDKKLNAIVKRVSWDPQSGKMQLGDFSMTPLISREENFLKEQWQGDFITIKGKELRLSGIKNEAGGILRIDKIEIDSADLNASRDKQLPFHHGIEKPMPTRLIRKIPLPVKADTILIRHSDVTYNERSASTRKWSTIPIKDINGAILNITNEVTNGDSLEVFATGRLLGNEIRHFSYTESYLDSLSSFRAESRLSPIQLTRFSEVSVPMAAVSIIDGRADTLNAYWEGNKYAAYGDMNFPYHDLKIKIHNHDETRTKAFRQTLLSFLANLILPNRKQHSSVIFVERNREKFIFNYWVNTHTRGLLSTIGIKSNKKYRAAYIRKQKQYSLPLKTKAELKKKR